MDLLSVVKRALTATCGELLTEHRIVDDSNFCHFVDQQRNRNCRVRKAVNEIHCAVDRIDDPCWRIGQLNLFAFARLLLADELVIRELASDTVH